MSRPQRSDVFEREPLRLPTGDLVGLYLLFLAVYLLFNAGHFFSTDHVAVYLTAVSIAERGSLALPHAINDAVLGVHGQYYANYGIGQSVAVLPLYWLGRWVDSVGSPGLRAYLSGMDLGQWGGTVPIFFVSLFNQFISPLNCLLVYLFCLRLGYTRLNAMCVTLAYGLGTMAWVQARDSFQHPLETLFLLLSMYVVLAGTSQAPTWRAFLSGAAFAGGLLVRISTLVVLPVCLIYACIAPSGPPEASSLEARLQDADGAVWGRAPTGRRGWGWRLGTASTLRRAAVFLIPVCAAVALTMILNRNKYGSVWIFQPKAQEAGLGTPLWQGLYGNLLSPGRGLFLYSPPILAWFWAVKDVYRLHCAQALALAGIVCEYVLAYSAYGIWHGGWAYGPRFLLPTIPLLVIPIAGWITTVRRRWALAALTTLGIGVQLLGVLVNYAFIYNEWLTWGLFPEDAYLWVPQLSAIPTHWRAVWSGRHIDVWLLWVLKNRGTFPFLATLAVELGMMAAGLWLLGAFRPRGKAPAFEHSSHGPDDAP